MKQLKTSGNVHKNIEKLHQMITKIQGEETQNTTNTQT